MAFPDRHDGERREEHEPQDGGEAYRMDPPNESATVTQCQVTQRVDASPAVDETAEARARICIADDGRDPGTVVTLWAAPHDAIAANRDSPRRVVRGVADRTASCVRYLAATGAVARPVSTGSPRTGRWGSRTGRAIRLGWDREATLAASSKGWSATASESRAPINPVG